LYLIEIGFARQGRRRFGVETPFSATVRSITTCLVKIFKHTI